DIAETQLKSFEIDFNELEEEETTLCECGEHKAEFKLIDEFKNDLKLCIGCLEEQENEYKEEGTEYIVSLLK
ncbi:MAG: hypothetical protein ACRCX2_36445, partial [Paraclostridium sp.]